MCVHSPLLLSPFFLFWFGEMCCWDSQLVLCVVLLFEITRNVSGILPTALSNFITAHFTSSGKTLIAVSATTMGKCKFSKCWFEQPEFSWLKAVHNDEFEAQCTLCNRTLNLGTLSVKAHKIGKTPVSLEMSPAKWHYHTLLYAFFTSSHSKFIQFHSTQTLHCLCRLAFKW